MACHLCGEVCTCSYASPADDPAVRPIAASDEEPLAVSFAPDETEDAGQGFTGGLSRRAQTTGGRTTVLIDPDSYDASEEYFAVSLEGAQAEEAPPPEARMESSPAAATATPAPAHEALTGLERAAQEMQQGADSDGPDSWREEVASRVHSYRARRRREPDSDTLRLDFGGAEETPGPALEPAPRTTYVPPARANRRLAGLRAGEAPTTKIIEFPRPAPEPAVAEVGLVHACAALPVLEELAEPMLEKPRILDAPEIVETDPVTPQVPTVTLEESLVPEVAPAPEIELPLQAASLGQRGFAAAVDALVVLAATGAFAMVVTQVAGEMPRGRVALGMGAALVTLLWSVYHYIFLVHAGTTPGLELAHLALTSFEGRPLTRAGRRHRALAMLVSFAPLGMGFWWALLDADALGWHDRISRSYTVAPVD